MNPANWRHCLRAIRHTAKSTWLWILVWIVFVLVAAGAISVLYWDWLSAGESGSTTVRNVGLVIAAVIALPLAIWRSIVSERQAHTARTQSVIAERGLLNERYQKGAEMLGSEVLSVRLGGIYALQRLARENPKQYHIQVMRLFCAFVRHPIGKYVAAAEPIRGEPLTASAEYNVGWDKSGGDNRRNTSYAEADKTDQQNRVREDVQAIMEAIGTRSQVQIKLEQELEYVSKLSYADLRGLRIAGANLSGVELVEANLSDAVLLKVDLSSAKLYEADLVGANLSGAIFYKDGSLAKGLTQQQIAFSIAMPEDSPPLLSGLIDAKTGNLIDWNWLTGTIGRS